MVCDPTVACRERALQNQTSVIKQAPGSGLSKAMPTMRADEKTTRRKKKDKARERFDRQGTFSAKHIRMQATAMDRPTLERAPTRGPRIR